MISEPKPPTGVSAMAAWFRHLLEWIRSWRVVSIEGYREEQTTGGRKFKRTFSINPAGKSSPASSSGSFRGLYVSGTTYNSQDEVVVQSGPAQGTYISVIDNNNNDPSTGVGWMQIAPGNTVGMWT